MPKRALRDSPLGQQALPKAIRAQAGQSADCYGKAGGFGCKQKPTNEWRSGDQEQSEATFRQRCEDEQFSHCV
jgi:hypothetical protein